MFTIENGDIPASYVRLPEGNPNTLRFGDCAPQSYNLTRGFLGSPGLEDYRPCGHPRRLPKLRGTPKIGVFPKIGVPQNGRIIVENPLNMDGLGVPLSLEIPI